MNLMKKLPVALCLIIAFGSCKVDDPKPDGSVSYSLDGRDISTTADCVGDSYGIGVFGTKGNDDLEIFMDTTITEGMTYHVGRMPNNIAIVYTNMSNSRYFNSDTVTITVDRYDGDRISGTFAATVISGPTTKTITNGKFDAIIDYSSYSDSTYCGTLNTFRKKNILLHLNK